MVFAKIIFAFPWSASVCRCTCEHIVEDHTTNCWNEIWHGRVFLKFIFLNYFVWKNQSQNCKTFVKEFAKYKEDAYKMLKTTVGFKVSTMLGIKLVNFQMFVPFTWNYLFIFSTILSNKCSFVLSLISWTTKLTIIFN